QIQAPPIVVYQQQYDQRPHERQRVPAEFAAPAHQTIETAEQAGQAQTDHYRDQCQRVFANVHDPAAPPELWRTLNESRMGRNKKTAGSRGFPARSCPGAVLLMRSAVTDGRVRGQG